MTLEDLVIMLGIDRDRGFLIICDQRGIPNDEAIFISEALEKWKNEEILEYITVKEKDTVAVIFEKLYFDYVVKAPNLFNDNVFKGKSTGQIRFRTMEEALERAKYISKAFQTRCEVYRMNDYPQWITAEKRFLAIYIDGE